MRKIDPEMNFMILHKWFHENHVVLNPGTCHYIVTDDDPIHQIKLLVPMKKIFRYFFRQ